MRLRAHRLVLLGVGAGVVVLVVWVGRGRVVNPSGTPISHPPLRVLAPPTWDTPALDATGQFVATRTEQARERLDVIDAVTGDVVDRFAVSPDGVPRLTLVGYGWDDESLLWAASHTYEGHACVSATAFEPARRRFTPRACSDLPEAVLERHRTNARPSNDVLPPGADVPVQTRFMSGNARTVRSPDGALFAVDVTEREHRTLFGRMIPIFDVRLLDRHGRFVAQFGHMHLIGWARDGSLLVHDYPDDRVVSSTFNLASIPRQHLAEVLTRTGPVGEEGKR